MRGWIDKENAQIIVGKDGMWPTRWRWSVEAPIVYDKLDGDASVRSSHREMHRMNGEAFTKKRAWTRANEALSTMEAWR